MSITPDMERWLINAGYEYHCFISWAHTMNRDMTECARRVKETIEEMLALSIPKPRVFLDRSEITGGSDWQRKLMRALCKSVAMVSICAPIYYHPSHRWCGLEWAAMESLSQERIPDEDFKMIIPLLLKKDVPLPQAVSKIQYVDFSHVIIQGRHFYRTRDFREKILEIVNRIEQISWTLIAKRAVANCDQLILPTESAFSDYRPSSQPFPFRGK